MTTISDATPHAQAARIKFAQFSHKFESSLSTNVGKTIITKQIKSLNHALFCYNYALKEVMRALKK